MKRVGITGQNGFIGYHLFNKLKLTDKEFLLIPFERDYFNKPDELLNFVNKCDIIIHLAGLNRHNDEHLIFEENILLASKLIDALNKSTNKVHLLFSSSIQESQNNQYGKSKKLAGMLFEKWSTENNTYFNNLIIPNVFGAFCSPYYNSFISTFSVEILNNRIPSIINDNSIDLIYIDNLVSQIVNLINNPSYEKRIVIKPDINIKVSEVLDCLLSFYNDYIESNIIPELNNSFKINLFNTFRSYVNYDIELPIKYFQNIDDRGSFIEVLKSKCGGQVSFSTTKPGITRGNHFHTRKIERFSVIKGKARIELRRIGTDKIFQFYLDGDKPSFVDIPIWYTHNITNIGNENLYTIFWINEFYDEKNSDTFFENV